MLNDCLRFGRAFAAQPLMHVKVRRAFVDSVDCWTDMRDYCVHKCAENVCVRTQRSQLLCDTPARTRARVILYARNELVC